MGEAANGRLCGSGSLRCLRDVKRHADTDPSALARRGMNDDLAADEADALAHANQAESAALAVARQETHALIGNLQRQPVVLARDPHQRALRAAVFDDVVQRFLRDSVQTERCVGAHANRHVAVRELHRDVMLERRITAERFERRHQADCAELGRVELVRQPVDVAGDL